MSVERILLDPAAVAAPGRVEIDLTADDGPIQVGKDGPQWGESASEPYMADGEYGAIPVDHTRGLRPVEIPLVILDTPSVSFYEARRLAQQWVGLVQQTYKGWLVRELSDGRRIYADVVRATLKLGGDEAQAYGWADANAVLSLETLPDWYEDEELFGSGTLTGGGTVRLAHDGGDMPSRVRVEIRDTSGVDQRSLVYAVRPEQSEPTAAIDFGAADLTPLGSARLGVDFLEHQNLLSTWIAVMSTDVAGVGPMTHVGPHRLLVLTERSSMSGTAQMCIEWAAGSAAPQRTRVVTVAAGASWADFGQIQLPAPMAGARGWAGRLLINAPNGTTLRVRRLLVLPVAYAHGTVEARATMATSASLLALETAETGTGTLRGRTAAVGGRWAELGAGNAFAITDGVITRTGTGVQIAYLDGSRAAAINATTTIDATFTRYTTLQSVGVGIAARVVDASNYLAAGVLLTAERRVSIRTEAVWIIDQVVGGVRTQLAVPAPAILPATFIRVVVGTDGVVALYRDGTLVLQAQSRQLATGGALASGYTGFYHAGDTAESLGIYGGLTVQASTALDAAVFANRTGSLRTEGYAREGADGLYGQQVPIGTLPRIEGSPAELYVRPMRSPLGQAVDPAVADGCTVSVYGRRCHLFTP